MLNFKLFQKYNNIVYGFSNKDDGSMRVTAGDPKEYAENKKNREMFFERGGIGVSQVVTADLRHSAKVVVVEKNDAGGTVQETDGLVTTVKDLFLSVTSADCIPLYLFDGSGVVGIAHAGWRGVVRGIITNIVSVMIENGAKKETILAGIGPGIQKCHFEIQNNVLGHFKQYQDAVIRHDGKIFVDLPAIIACQLDVLGIPLAQIDISDQCTCCIEQEYFSYRRDKVLNVMAAYIGMKK